MSSSGPAGEAQNTRMGVFRLTNETNNKNPVWSNHRNQKIFYDDGKFINCDDDDVTGLLLIMILQRGTG